MVTLYLLVTKKNLLSFLASSVMFLCMPSKMRVTLLRVISNSWPPLNMNSNDHEKFILMILAYQSTFSVKENVQGLEQVLALANTASTSALARI